MYPTMDRVIFFSVLRKNSGSYIPYYGSCYLKAVLPISVLPKDKAKIIPPRARIETIINESAILIKIEIMDLIILLG